MTDDLLLKLRAALAYERPYYDWKDWQNLSDVESARIQGAEEESERRAKVDEALMGIVEQVTLSFVKSDGLNEALERLRAAVAGE